MELEGSYAIPAPRQAVWEAFLDPERLRQALPGCEKLEKVGVDEYKATLKAGVGAVKGTFEGKVRLFDLQPPQSYRMTVEGSGGPGVLPGEAALALRGSPHGGTTLSHTPDLPGGGLIAGVGQRMLRGGSH